MREAILIAIQPIYAERILAGTKRAELRRVRPNVQPGQRVLIYASSPTMALLGTAVVEKTEGGAPVDLWKRVEVGAGVTRAEYDSYFDGAQHAAAIWLADIVRFERPVSLGVIRTRWPWLRIPQSYCFVQAAFDSDRRIRRLAPRAAVASSGVANRG